jgi:putative PIN family toxin of toxin-antitoxin system
MPRPIQVVIDTNVFIAALRSKTGAGSKIFSLLPDQRWENNISPALLFEYEEQGRKIALQRGYTFEELNEFLEAIIGRSNGWHQEIIRKPRLPDPDDDFVLDLALTAKADHIITYNTRNFRAAKSEEIEVTTPGDFLKLLIAL